MRKELSFEEMLERNHYKSIIRLTKFYQEKIKNFKGLRAIQYRYALCPNHDGINKYSPFFYELKKFFGDDLKKLYEDKIIIKDCVTDRKNLSNFLRHLTEKGILIKQEKDNVPNYFLSIKIYGLINKISSIRALNTYNPFSVQYYPNPFKNDMLSATWFGSPETMSLYSPKKYGKFELSTEDKDFIEKKLAEMFKASLELYSFFDEKKKGMHPMTFVLEVKPPLPLLDKQFKCVFEE